MQDIEDARPPDFVPDRQVVRLDNLLEQARPFEASRLAALGGDIKPVDAGPLAAAHEVQQAFRDNLQALLHRLRVFPDVPGQERVAGSLAGQHKGRIQGHHNQSLTPGCFYQSLHHAQRLFEKVLFV